MHVMAKSLLGQLPTRDNSSLDKNKTQLLPTWAPLHKTMVTLQLMISLQSMVTIINFLTLIGYGAVLLW